MAKELNKSKLLPAGKLKAVKDPPIKRVEPDEWYKVRLDDLQIGKGLYGPYMKITFKLLVGELEGTKESAKGLTINTMLNAILSPKEKLWKFATVILGREPEIDEEVDLKSHLGEKFRALIKDKIPKKDSKDQRIFQYVDTIKIPKKVVAEKK